MPDLPDQMIYTLQQENKNLKKILKEKEKKLQQKGRELQQKGRALEQKDRELDLERSLWKSRDGSWDAGKWSALHRLEVLDDIIRDGDMLRQATLADGPKFRYMLERAERFLRDSGQMPLFRDDERRASDPGNRCKLYLRHALLMALVHKKDNPTQGVLAAFFGIDQTTVSRYLQVMDRMLAETLSTAAKISEEIAGAATQEEFKRIVPGQGGGDIFLDGTHCPVQRPSEKTLRRMKYSGKKKRFTNNTNVYTNRDGVIIGISESTVGSVGDITLLKERPMPFGKWEEAMHDADRPEGERNRIFCDRGFQGIADHLPGTAPMIPHKEDEKIPTDAGAEGAQQQDQLGAGAGRAFHRKAQALRPRHRPLRRDRGAVQQGIQRDNRACKPEPAVGPRAQGGPSGRVEDVSRLGTGPLKGSRKIGIVRGAQPRCRAAHALAPLAQKIPQHASDPFH